MANVDEDAAKTRKSLCAECARETSHHVRGESRRGAGGEDELSWSETTYFLECAGCGSTSIQKVYWDDNYDRAYDDPDVKLYPAALSRPKPEWLWQVDSKFRLLFEEVYVGLGAGTVALPVMGARAILDVVIQDRVGDQGGFAAGLDALVARGLVSQHDRGILDAAVEAGNAAAHRGFFPTKDDSRRVIEIVEHLVSSLYVLKLAAKGIKKATPKRRRKRKAKARPAKAVRPSTAP